VPRRVFAPHLGAVFGSPGGFPFFSQPLRLGFICPSNCLCVIFPADFFSDRFVYGSNDRLTTVVDIYVPDDHRLADLATVAIQTLHLRRERSQQSNGTINVGVNSLRSLPLH